MQQILNKPVSEFEYDLKSIHSANVHFHGIGHPR